MIRGILTFIALWGAIFFGLSYFWHISRQEKLDMVKMATYSGLTALVALVVLVAIVILF